MRRGRRRSLVRPIAAAMACLAFGLAAPAPASAYLQNFEQLNTRSTTDSAGSRTLFLRCPAGKMILGVGAGADPEGQFPLNGVGLQRMWLPIPSPAGPDAIVRAVATDSVSRAWFLFTERYCATDTTTAPETATRGQYLKAPTYVFNTLPPSLAGSKSVSAGCPAGRLSIGGGFTLVSTGDVTARAAARFAQGFGTRAERTDPFPRIWGLSAVAICSELSPSPGVFITGITSRIETTEVSSDNKTRIADCPAETTTIGGGVELVGPSASTPEPPGEVVLAASRPTVLGGRGTGWIGSAWEEDPTSTSWKMAIRVICAYTARI